MQEQHDNVSRMQAVTVSREYGSGGGEIARRLASHLGWQLIDHEIVVRVARSLEISEEEAQARDEHGESVVSRILTSMQGVDPGFLVAAPMPPPISTETYNEALRDVVMGAIATGHVVIVGRGSQTLLANRRDVLHVRIIAPLDQRVSYVMQREGLDADAARERIQLKDRDRERYLQNEYHLRSDDPHLYDLVLNMSVLDLNGGVDLIAVALAHKAARLSIPTGQLGPVTGLSRYPGQPGDFRPPTTPKPAAG
jgi:cytidylate kinase